LIPTGRSGSLCALGGRLLFVAAAQRAMVAGCWFWRRAAELIMENCRPLRRREKAGSVGRAAEDSLRGAMFNVRAAVDELQSASCSLQAAVGRASELWAQLALISSRALGRSSALAPASLLLQLTVRTTPAGPLQMGPSCAFVCIRLSISTGNGVPSRARFRPPLASWKEPDFDWPEQRFWRPERKRKKCEGKDHPLVWLPRWTARLASFQALGRRSIMPERGGPVDFIHCSSFPPNGVQSELNGTPRGPDWSL